MSPSTVRPTIEAVRVVVGADGRYEWTDLSDPPRPPAQLPKDDGLGLGLHATQSPARWSIDWWAVLRVGIIVLCCGAWIAAGYGVYHLLWCRP